MLVIVRRLLLVVFAALVLWRIVAVGVSSIYMEQAVPGLSERATMALAWYPSHPEARYRSAASLDGHAAAVQLREAYALNPADVRPLLALARLANEQGDAEQAGALAAEAARLEPANRRIQQQTAALWASQGNLERAMRHWSRALEADPSTQKNLFPILLEIAENPQLRGLLSPYAQNPPPWWENFFSETARRALDVQTVAALHSLRRKAADAPITPAERTAYIARLQRDGLVTAAYLAWINGLTPDERTQLGVLHNGGFELPPTSTGFDWHIRQPEGVIIQTASTYGVQGSKALQLIFKRWEKPFNHVHQPLFLDPGTYRITGRVRTDSLQSVGGLKWVALCRLPEAGVLAESERFLGSSEWRDFSFEVTIPETCVAQELRLSSAGSRDFERAMKGSVWFDALSARRIAPASPPSPVAAVTQPAAAGPIPDTPTTDEATGSPAVPAPDPDASPSTGSAGDAQAPSPAENVGAPAPDAGGAPRLESVGPINTE